MRKKILITGATGFVGYHLIEGALRSGLDVIAAVRKNSITNHLSHFNIQYLELNYNSVSEMKLSLESQQFHYIIHAAGVTKAKNRTVYDMVNAEYSKHLALAASEAKIPLEKFVFISSLAALGPLQNAAGLLTENSAASPVTSYGSSKLLAETYLLQIRELPLVILRPTAIYGPREKDLLILFKSINNGLEPYIGNFEQHLSFIYVKDLVQVCMQALNGPWNQKAYNLSDGVRYERYALANFIKEALGKKTLKFHIPIGLMSCIASVMDFLYKKSKRTPTVNNEKLAELMAPNWSCDISSAKKDLNFDPAYNLQKGILETVKWYRAQGWLN